MKNRLFILVAAIVAVMSLSSCAKVKWEPDFVLDVDYRTCTLPATMTNDGSNYYENPIQVWSIGSWAADLTIEGDAVWCGFEIDGNLKPTGTHITGQGSKENYVQYVPLYFLVNGAQEPRYASIRFYRTDMDVERVMQIKQNGR